MSRLSRAILEQIIALRGEPLLVADLECPGCPVVFVNRAFEDLIEARPGAVDGRRWSFFLDEDSSPGELEAMLEQVRSGSAAEIHRTARDSRRSRLRLSAMPLRGGQGRVRYMLLDIARAAPAPVATGAASSKLREKHLDGTREPNGKPGRRDPDTGLLRYSYFLELCQRDFALCSRQGRELAVLVFTVREFDAYRDTFGEKAAQSCLRMVGGRIAGALRRAGDLCARLEESSFVALITDHNYEQAARFAEHISHQVRRLALHHPRATGDRYVTCRVGLKVAVPEHQDWPEQFVLAARASDEGSASAGKPAA